MIGIFFYIRAHNNEDHSFYLYIYILSGHMIELTTKEILFCIRADKEDHSLYIYFCNIE